MDETLTGAWLPYQGAQPEHQSPVPPSPDKGQLLSSMTGSSSPEHDSPVGVSTLPEEERFFDSPQHAEWQIFQQEINACVQNCRNYWDDLWTKSEQSMETIHAEGEKWWTAPDFRNWLILEYFHKMTGRAGEFTNRYHLTPTMLALRKSSEAFYYPPELDSNPYSHLDVHLVRALHFFAVLKDDRWWPHIKANLGIHANGGHLFSKIFPQDPSIAVVAQVEGDKRSVTLDVRFVHEIFFSRGTEKILDYLKDYYFSRPYDTSKPSSWLTTDLSKFMFWYITAGNADWTSLYHLSRQLKTIAHLENQEDYHLHEYSQRKALDDWSQTLWVEARLQGNSPFHPMQLIAENSHQLSKALNKSQMNETGFSPARVARESYRSPLAQMAGRAPEKAQHNWLLADVMARREQYSMEQTSREMQQRVKVEQFISQVAAYLTDLYVLAQQPEQQQQIEPDYILRRMMNLDKQEIRELEKMYLRAQDERHKGDHAINLVLTIERLLQLDILSHYGYSEDRPFSLILSQLIFLMQRHIRGGSLTIPDTTEDLLRDIVTQVEWITVTSGSYDQPALDPQPVVVTTHHEPLELKQVVQRINSRTGSNYQHIATYLSAEEAHSVAVCWDEEQDLPKVIEDLAEHQYWQWAMRGVQLLRNRDRWLASEQLAKAKSPSQLLRKAAWLGADAVGVAAQMQLVQALEQGTMRNSSLDTLVLGVAGLVWTRWLLKVSAEARRKGVAIELIAAHIPEGVKTHLEWSVKVWAVLVMMPTVALFFLQGQEIPAPLAEPVIALNELTREVPLVQDALLPLGGNNAFSSEFLVVNMENLRFGRTPRVYTWPETGESDFWANFASTADPDGEDFIRHGEFAFDISLPIEHINEADFEQVAAQYGEQGYRVRAQLSADEYQWNINWKPIKVLSTEATATAQANALGKVKINDGGIHAVVYEYQPGHAQAALSTLTNSEFDVITTDQEAELGRTEDSVEWQYMLQHGRQMVADGKNNQEIAALFYSFYQQKSQYGLANFNDRGNNHGDRLIKLTQQQEMICNQYTAMLYYFLVEIGRGVDAAIVAGQVEGGGFGGFDGQQHNLLLVRVNPSDPMSPFILFDATLPGEENAELSVLDTPDLNRGFMEEVQRQENQRQIIQAILATLVGLGTLLAAETLARKHGKGLSQRQLRRMMAAKITPLAAKLVGKLTSDKASTGEPQLPPPFIAIDQPVSISPFVEEKQLNGEQPLSDARQRALYDSSMVVSYLIHALQQSPHLTQQHLLDQATQGLQRGDSLRPLDLPVGQRPATSAHETGFWLQAKHLLDTGSWDGAAVTEFITNAVLKQLAEVESTAELGKPVRSDLAQLLNQVESQVQGLQSQREKDGSVDEMAAEYLQEFRAVYSQWAKLLR